MRKKLLEAIAKGLREVGVYNIDIDHISEAVRRHVEPLMNKTEFGLDEETRIALTAVQGAISALSQMLGTELNANVEVALGKVPYVKIQVHPDSFLDGTFPVHHLSHRPAGILPWVVRWNGDHITVWALMANSEVFQLSISKRALLSYEAVEALGVYRKLYEESDSERPQIQEEYITPVCPLAKAYENPQCRGKQCAWFDRENNRCAVLSLAETLSFLNDTVSMFYDKGGSHD